MKKWLVLLICMILFPFQCFAAEDRWVWFRNNGHGDSSYFDKDTLKYDPRNKQVIVWTRGESATGDGNYILMKWLIDYGIKCMAELEYGIQYPNGAVKMLPRKIRVLSSIKPGGYSKQLVDQVASHLKIPRVYGNQEIRWKYLGNFFGEDYYITPDANVYFKSGDSFHGFIRKGPENRDNFTIDLSFKGYSCNFKKHQIAFVGMPEEVIPGTREESIYNAAYKMYTEGKYTAVNDRYKFVSLDKNGQPVTPIKEMKKQIRRNKLLKAKRAEAYYKQGLSKKQH